MAGRQGAGAGDGSVAGGEAREQLKQLEGLPIEYRLGEHRSEDFTSTDLVVASPAIPPSEQYLAAARRGRGAGDD